jgi:glycosyltransferase involved in cell wall biosynthesis
MHEKVTGPGGATGMGAMSSAWVVVPAYNEGTVIGATVDELLQWFENVVVIDDCSTDQTRKSALDAGAHVVRHPVNLGQGAALATGIAYTLRQGAQCIVTFDADGQHSASEAAAMVALLYTKGVDVVLGSRFLGAARGIGAGRRALLKLTVLFTRLTTGLQLTDSHNGLRVLSRRAADLIRIRQNRMAHASEILDQIATHRMTFVESPCTITYTEYSKAKGQRWTGAFSILFDLLARRLYR